MTEPTPHSVEGTNTGKGGYVAASLADEPAITFNAGTHTEAIKMAYEDFEQLVHPKEIDFCTT
jgi:Ala-tRNA(Pro) deacylase